MQHPQRIALCVRYDGSNYYGWQRQEGLDTIQAQLEKALSLVANHPVTVVGAGRTDAGVHATGQIVHFDTDAVRSEHAWVFGANTHLPRDISVMWVRPVSLDFHARYSALSRRYRYIIYNHEIRPAVLAKAVSWYYRGLEVELIQQSVPYLIGEHDFSAFRGAGCQSNTPIREVFNIEIVRQQKIVTIDVEANAFLLHMVRNIVGVLMTVGSGVRPPKWVKEVLESRDRRRAAMTASPHGLYFVEVNYSAEFDLPKAPESPLLF